MGTGLYGGFSNTYGSNRDETPVSSQNDVSFNRKKVEEYLLNLNHPQGGAKAKFMSEVLGYTQADSKLFHKNVVNSLIGKAPMKTEHTPFGIKHTYHTNLIGKKGNSVSANVVVVIQKDNECVTYKIVTVYPDKKGK